MQENTKRLRIIRVLISCPSDCEPHASGLKRKVEDIGEIIRQTSGIMFEIRSWPESIVPYRSERPQEVVNSQVADIDLYVGVFWTRLGSDTGIAESGTVEEYQNFLGANNVNARYTLVYRDVSPIDPTGLDYSQLARLNEYLTKLQAEGQVVRTVMGPDGFVEAAYLDMVKMIQELQRDGAEVDTTNKHELPLQQSTSPMRIDDGDGILELWEQLEGAVPYIVSELDAYSGDMATLTKQLASETQRINKAQETGFSRDDATRYASRVAAILDGFSESANRRNTRLEEQFDSLLSVAQRYLIAWPDVTADGRRQFADELQSLSEAARTVQPSFTSMLEGLNSIPQMTRQFKIAQSKCRYALESTLGLLAKISNTIEVSLR